MPPPRAYAAPELHAGGSQHALASEASDLHALGLVAFEVLSGASPWQPGAATRTASGGWKWARPSDLAADWRLRRGLRGGFDAIVARATQADPARRYAGMAELLADLRRAAAGLPVAAVGGGLLYRFRRLAGRHPRLVSATLVITLVFATTFAVTAWKAASWRLQRDEAQAAHRNAETVSTLVRSALEASTRAGALRDWPGMLTDTESLARSSLGGQPAGLASVLAVLGRHQAERILDERGEAE